MSWKPKQFRPPGFKTREQRTREYEITPERKADKAFYDSKRWRAFRKWYLGINPLCVECEKAGRVERASELDHIIDRKDALERAYDETNVQGLCTTHHSQKTRRTARVPRRNPCTVVCGPPGSGKTTYVKERIQAGDLVLDRDDLWAAITWLPQYHKPEELHPYVQAARDIIVKMLGNDPSRPRSWVITCAPKKVERDYLRSTLGAEIVMLDVEADECIARINADVQRTARRQEWIGFVNQWWETYEP